VFYSMKIQTQKINKYTLAFAYVLVIFTVVTFVTTQTSIISQAQAQPQPKTPTQTQPKANTKPAATSTNSNTKPASSPTNQNNNQTSAIDTSVSTTGQFDPDASSGQALFNPLEINSLPELVVALIRVLFSLIGTLAVIVIIVAGFRMVISRGNESEYKAAKEALTWSVIGLGVALLSFSLVEIVQRVIRS
jgi:hypothetical protein